MKKIARFLFDTWYGALAACAVSAAALLAAWTVVMEGAASGTRFGFWESGCAVALLAAVFLGLSLLALAAAFVRSLWKRAWGRAAAQLLLGLAGAAVFTFVGIVAAFAMEGVPWRAPWVEVEEKNGVVPFEVEYRRAPGGHFRRVAFPSGKRVVIATDTGKHAELAVYALADGTFALADAGGALFRVDAAAEAVDLGMDIGVDVREHPLYRGCGFAALREGFGEDPRWFRLPAGTVKIWMWNKGGFYVNLENGEERFVTKSVPLCTSMEGRRLVGKFVPFGKFEREAEDLLAPEP
jgi:hypothetical protein